MNTIPHLTYQQYRAVRRMVHECCNYDDGNCLALDNGWEPCICVQSISGSINCSGSAPPYCLKMPACARPCSTVTE